MAATYTHQLFTEDVYKLLDDKIKILIDINSFYTFGKSFDILFFSGSKLGSYAHNNKVNEYFDKIIFYIKNNNLNNNKQAMGYLMGSICHYVLDSIMHPFIYFYAGKYDCYDKSTYKNKGMHAYIENMFDAFMYKERNNKDIYNVNLGKLVFFDFKFNKELYNMIDEVFYDVFGCNKGVKLVKRGYKNYKFIFKHGMVSKFGVKSGLYKLVDKCNIYKKCKFNNYCYYIKNIDTVYFNLEHDVWCYPVDKKFKYHYSLLDLYDNAIVKAVNLISFVSDILNNDGDIKLALKEIGNNSYLTGVDANKNLSMKYYRN